MKSLRQRSKPNKMIYLIDDIFDHIIYFTTNKIYDLCLVNKHFNDNCKRILITDNKYYPKLTNENLRGLVNLISLYLDRYSKISFEGLFDPRKILSLDLGNGVNYLNLEKLPNLTKLKLEDNYRFTIKELLKVPNLISLDLSCGSYIGDDDIKQLTNLTSLNLSANMGITNEGLSVLTNLLELDISYNYSITSKGISTLTNLTSLNLDQNTRVFINDISMLTNLTSINFGENRYVDKFIDVNKIFPKLTNIIF